jgi:hypothetical protein
LITLVLVVVFVVAMPQAALRVKAAAASAAAASVADDEAPALATEAFFVLVFFGRFFGIPNLLHLDAALVSEGVRR